MSKFNHLPKGELYNCRLCKKSDHWNYFVSRTLCKRCASRRNSRRRSQVVQLSENIVITTEVENRLRKSAEQQVSKNPGYFVPDIASVLALLSVCFLGMVFAISSIPKPNIGDLWWLVGIAWLYIAYKVAILVGDKLGGMKDSWDTKVNLSILENAGERAERIRVQGSFYSSPEWKLLRDIVIEEEGRDCVNCGMAIRNDADVTVDHILPRSKYPDLALQLGEYYAAPATLLKARW